MYLKKLKIQGFKSFADKTEIEFKEGITGIVGPNGSGKSNISDAIRWVLGEQSVKTLRGSKMQDIIFSGTDKRKPVGYAEVTIVFDNKDGAIPIEYSEVSVTRRMFGSGESEYYINKNSCRLKDIKELFMDTGVGKDGYSIVGQGRVDEILSTKSEDRRHIFEEASGIVKYKNRKEVSEKKLEKTDENLVRINDIVFELEGQVEPLEKQAVKAKRYLELAQKLEELEVDFYVKEIYKLKKELMSIESRRNNLNLQIKESLDKKNNIEDKYFSIKTNIENINKSIEEMQEKKYSIQSSVEKKDNELVVCDEKEKFYLEERKRLKKEKDEFLEKKKQLIFEQEKIKRELKEKNEELIKLKSFYLKEKKLLEDINDKIIFKERVIEKEKDGIIKVYNLISEKKNKVNGLEILKQNIRNRIVEVEKEVGLLKKDDIKLEKLLKKLYQEKNSKHELLINCENSRKDFLEKKQRLENENDTLSKEIDKKRGLLQGKTSNYKLLKNMEDEYEGYYKSVRRLLLASKKNSRLNEGILGVVGELIKVDKKYQKSIEIALGSSIQNVVINTEEDAKEAIQFLKTNNLGRVTFLPLTSIRGKKLNINLNKEKANGAIGLASHLIKIDEKYRNIFDYLLGRTLIVEDIDCAMKLSKKYKYSIRIVTLDGELFNPGGSITGGSMFKNSTSILNRKTRMEELLKEINVLEEELSLCESNSKDLRIKLDEIEKLVEKSKEEIQKLNIEIIKLENEITKIVQDNEKKAQVLLKYNDEICRLKEEENDIDMQIDELNKDLIKLKEEKNLTDKNISNKVKSFQDERNIKEEIDKKVTNFKIQINAFEERINSLKNKVENIKGSYKNISDSIDEKENDYEENCRKVEELKNIRQGIYKEVDKFKLLLSDCSVELEEQKNHKEDLIKNFTLEQKKLNEIEKNMNILEKEVNSLNVDYTKYNVKIENYNSRLLEEYDINYKEVSSYTTDVKDRTKIKTEIKDLKDKIKNLGTVNLGAVEEYERLKERLEFLQIQKNDLLSAKSNLNEVIKDIEKEMEERFGTSFNIIRKNFNQVFKELFGGGKADVYLIDEKNILSSGIEIIAQPPGKKLQSLSLLSGGEKSLTAVALLFAILKTKPTPFCILDEIDAALDEANISRYINYLKSFSDDTQFIMITHRKGSMEMADILYGVTMEEEGVSRIISIKLSDRAS